MEIGRLPSFRKTQTTKQADYSKGFDKQFVCNDGNVVIKNNGDNTEAVYDEVKGGYLFVSLKIC